MADGNDKQLTSGASELFSPRYHLRVLTGRQGLSLEEPECLVISEMKMPGGRKDVD